MIYTLLQYSWFHTIHIGDDNFVRDLIVVSPSCKNSIVFITWMQQFATYSVYYKQCSKDLSLYVNSISIDNNICYTYYSIIGIPSAYFSFVPSGQLCTSILCGCHIVMSIKMYLQLFYVVRLCNKIKDRNWFPPKNKQQPRIVPSVAFCKHTWIVKRKV